MTRRFEVGPVLIALGAVVLAALLLVTAELINPPPAAGGEDIASGAWIAFGSTLAMFLGTVLTFGRVRFAVSVEGRTIRERVPVVDHRQDTTETAAISPDAANGAGVAKTESEGARASE